MPPVPDGPQSSGRLHPPGLGLLLAEARGLFEFNASLLLSPVLMRAPKGDGHPVLALPGFLASDFSMAPMRRYLGALGYEAHAWRMGRNLGGLGRMRDLLRARLAAIHAASGRKVSLVGWSLGGVYARDLALQAPDMVRNVITLGSPFANDIRATNATRLYEMMVRRTGGGFRRAARGDRRRSAGAGNLGLFACRRHRELADLPATSLRPRREHRGAPGEPYRARGESRSALGRGGPSCATGGGVLAI
ncbi:pimeloyl-ACP methyl ester carboxylesterase [Bradyrhizobium sp. LB1.3]